VTPLEIQVVTKKVNACLKAINDQKHTGMPMREIAIALTDNDLDPEKIYEQWHGDNGRMHVQIGPEIYLVMTWYRMETGRYEVVIYATSNFDDYREPYKTVMNSTEKRKAKNKLNKLLTPITNVRQQNIFAAFDLMQEAIVEAGFDGNAFEQSTVNMRIGHEGRRNIDIGNGIFLTFTWYREPDSNHKWEIVAYAS
jgi:hypothetical protein